jgi:hypothetical protein
MLGVACTAKPCAAALFNAALALVLSADLGRLDDTDANGTLASGDRQEKCTGIGRSVE